MTFELRYFELGALNFMISFRGKSEGLRLENQ